MTTNHRNEAVMRVNHAHAVDPEHATYLLAKAQAHALIDVAGTLDSIRAHLHVLAVDTGVRAQEPEPDTADQADVADGECPKRGTYTCRLPAGHDGICESREYIEMRAAKNRLLIEHEDVTAKLFDRDEEIEALRDELRLRRGQTLDAAFASAARDRLLVHLKIAARDVTCLRQERDALREKVARLEQKAGR